MNIELRNICYVSWLDCACCVTSLYFTRSAFDIFFAAVFQIKSFH